MSLSGGTILFTYARHVILYLVLVEPRKRPDMAENFLTGMGGSRGGGDDIAKLLGQNLMLGHHRDASETPFKWRFAGGPMIARF